MTFCYNCGADEEENQKFCPECGTRIENAEHKSVSPPPPLSVAEATSARARNAPLSFPAGSQSNIPPQKQGILGRVDIDKEDIDEVAGKAKKGLGAAWNLARKGISKGAELTSQGIEAAKETIDDRHAQQPVNQHQQPYQAPQPAPALALEGSKFCPDCGQPASPGMFCNHRGQRLE